MFDLDQKHFLLNKMGYTGPKSEGDMDKFVQANPAIAARFGKFENALRRGFAEGGVVRPEEKSRMAVTDAPTPQPTAQANPYSGATADLSNPSNFQTVANNPTGFIQTAQQGSSLLNEQIQKAQESLNADPENTELQQNLATLQGQFNTMQSNIQTAQGLMTQGAAQQQQYLTSQAMSNPMSVAQAAEVQNLEATPETLMGADTGQAGNAAQMTASTVQNAAQAENVNATGANLASTSLSQQGVADAVQNFTGEQGQVSQEVQAQQQNQSSVSDLQAAQGQAIMMTNPTQREIQAGELISGSTVDHTKVEQMNAQLQAAQATPSEQATVQGQLENLMADFEGGATPAWAAGAIRNASAQMAARGLGASSMAGQAILQSTMEAALPIAQADANTRASFEAQNLSNRQQVAMFAAEQRAAFLGQEFDQEFQSRVINASRIADIANMNFTAEQQIALENSRAANTMNLANLGNSQAMTLAEASALANLDTANLNNRQQAAVVNAQNFLQMDMTNLSNAQQAALFGAQSNVQALFTDQAAENAQSQFNASSQNQTDQFFANLASQIQRFNAEQSNAVSIANIDAENAASQLNASLINARDEFNAQNSLIIAQANAQWRQNIATTNTATQNEANMQQALVSNQLTMSALDNIWQRERDLMSFAFNSGENQADRDLQLLLGERSDEMIRWQEDQAEEAAMWEVAAGLLFGGF